MMGGAVSSGESNDDLIDNLKGSDYIKTPGVERIFRAVDRAFYYTKPYKQNAYKDIAWRDGNLHLSAPCIYSEVMENLNLEPGMSFLNIGSGTGYLSTMAGLIIGHKGNNHGIEIHEDVIEYARAKLQVFLKTSPALDMFDFCEPQFIVGNCLELLPSPRRYDRIYCGAACESSDLENIIDLLKLGGICVVPMSDSLVKMTRVSESKVEMKTLLPVSFATLVPSKNSGKKTIPLPEWNPSDLAKLCRAEIRGILRQSFTADKMNGTYLEGEDGGRKKRRKKRNDRRRANRLQLVQHRRNLDPGAERRENLSDHSESSLESSEEDGPRWMPKVVARQIALRKKEEESKQATSSEQTEPTNLPDSSSSAPTDNHASCASAEGTSEGTVSNGQPETSQRQAWATRSETILGRIRELVRNRQLARQALQSTQAQLLLDVEHALREPVEGEEGNLNPASVDAIDGNDEDEIDHECVWTSNDSSSSSSSSSSSTSSSSDGEGETKQVQPQNTTNESEALSGSSGARQVSMPLRILRSNSPYGGISISISPLSTSLEQLRGREPEVSNAQREIESIEEGNNEDALPAYNHFSFQMTQKINLLPLPPAIKRYLNYHRKM